MLGGGAVLAVRLLLLLFDGLRQKTHCLKTTKGAEAPFIIMIKFAAFAVLLHPAVFTTAVWHKYRQNQTEQ